MDHLKICVYAISKNEEQFADRWMDAVSEADLVVVADTGSTDRTIEKLRARGALVYPEQIVPWRFDEARNRALAHVPEDADICVSNDLDEVFEKGWRQKLENAWQPDTTRARYTFVWDHRDGMDKQFPMEKIHIRHGYRWIHPVHEVLAYGGTEKKIFVPGLVLHHYPDNGKPRGQYLPLLELSAKENPQDSQTHFWLGREYVYHNQYDAAIRTLGEYLSLPASAWDEEKSAAMRLIAECYSRQGKNAEAKQWLWRSIAQCPYVREPYLAMARHAYLLGEWPLAAFVASEGLKITRPTGSYLTEPEAWGERLYDYGAIACFQLGQYETAQQYAAEAVRINPGDERLRRNLALIRAKLPGAAPEGQE